MPRSFDADELGEMELDWQRTHNVKMVAELHGCTKRDVAEALGLSPAEIKIDAEKAKQWLDNGAQPTDTVREILKKAAVL